MGYGKTRKEVLGIVHAMVEKKGIKLENGVTQGWWVKFCKRWPEIKLRKGDSFPLVRDQMSNRTVFESYFDLLDETLTKHGLKDKPAQIYNCDESGIPLEYKLPRIVAAKGTKKVRQCTSGTKTQITILACANAAGQTIPPMVVFSGKHFNSALAKGEVPATLYGMSPSGWMDQELFREWFSEHFLKHAVSSRPLLLLLDGHSSHYTLDLVKTAAEEDVIIFCLPPHTTADSQPLDTSCFKPLKTHWVDVCRRYLFANPSRVITKFHFSSLFSEAWSKSMTINNISSGFRTTGVCPFNPDAILSKFPKQKETDESTTSKSPAKPVTFSVETVKKFERRFENGYNIYTDPAYVQWMRMYHPDHLPPEILDADVVTMGTATGSTSTVGIATGSTSTVGTATDSTSTVGTATDSTSTVGTATDSTSTVGTATGFCTTSVCPFNPAKPVTFSAETVKKFERRFENGYNIYTDPAYVQWMRMYYPDHLPPEILDADVVTVGTATGSTSTMGIATGSTSTVGTATGSTSTVGTATGSTSTVGMATGSTSTVGTATDSTSTVSMSTGSTSTVGTATSSTTARSPFSELLVYPTPTQRKSKPKSCARVLTSAKSIAMLEEKARKK
ncbi:mucin-3B-like isoform X1 [Dysidea avara]|uniref:mucin-3B-like isoform X1 n=1 Tax=Dysidea avara TaxID=196820 RepID=UPI003319A460